MAPLQTFTSVVTILWAASCSAFVVPGPTRTYLPHTPAFGPSTTFATPGLLSARDLSPGTKRPSFSRQASANDNDAIAGGGNARVPGPGRQTVAGALKAVSGVGEGQGGSGNDLTAVRRALVLAVWLSLIAYAFGPWSPGAAFDPRDTEILTHLYDTDSPVNSVFYYLFNELGVLPGIIASVLVGGGSFRKGRQPLPAPPFVFGAFLAGFFALGPYVALRNYLPEREEGEEMSTLESVLTSKLFAVPLVALSAYCGIGLASSLADPEAVASFSKLFWSSKAAHVSTLDFFILITLIVDPIREDMRRRGVEPELAKKAIYPSFAPCVLQLFVACWEHTLFSLFHSGGPLSAAHSAKPSFSKMVVFYNDLNKVARDILSDDYSLKRTLKMKHTTPHGLTVTSKSEHNKGVNGALEAKFFHSKSGVSIDKAKLNPDGSMGLEASRKDIAKDVKLVAKVNDVLKGEMSVEHTGPKSSTRATLDVEGAWMRTSSCVAVGSKLLVGAQGDFIVGAPKDSALKSYSIGASTGGSRWGASLTCTNKMQTYNASGYYILQPNLVGSVMAACTPETSENSFQAGVRYQCNPKTTIRAKVNSGGVVSACAVNKCCDKVSVTVTAAVAKNDSTPKFGLLPKRDAKMQLVLSPCRGQTNQAMVFLLEQRVGASSFAFTAVHAQAEIPVHSEYEASFWVTASGSGARVQAFVGHAPLVQPRSLWQASSSPAVSSARAAAPEGRRAGRAAVTRMGWGDDVVFSKAKITETEKLAEGQYGLTIDAGDIAAGYTAPGQYVQIRMGPEAKAGFFAIASPPDKSGLLEFLIKENDSTKPLVTSKAGATVEMSNVMGEGFPIAENFSGYKYDFPIQNVVLSATGTGIAPFRAAIESGVLELPDEEDDGVFGRSCKLYWGCHDEDSMPWKDRMEDWDKRGVEVVPVLSSPSSSWTGRTGFVQQAIKEDGIRLPRNSGVLVCGHKEMGEEVKDIALKAGVLDGRVLSNF
eukprot:g18566.t2